MASPTPTPTPTIYPTFGHFYEEYVAEEAARFEAASKVTAAALATTPEERAQAADNTKLIVGLYMDALRASRPYRDAEADSLAKTPHPEPRCGHYQPFQQPPAPAFPPYKGQYRSRMEEWSHPRKRAKREAKKPIAANKDAVISAHAGLVAGTVNQDDFMTTTRKFTLRRVSWRFKGTDQFGQTEDDITQIAMRKMWDALPTFKDTSEGFFVWFRTLIDNTVKDAKRCSLKESKRHAPLYVEIENDEGKSEEAENPGIFGSIQFKRNGKVTYQNPIQRRLTLPEFIQGKDLQICNYIREGYDYERIGPLVGLTKAGVESSVRRMRAKTRAE